MKKKIFVICFMLISFYSFADSKYLNKKFFHTDEYASVCISDNEIDLDDNVELGKLYHKEKYDLFEGINNKYIILETTVSETYFLYLIKKFQNSKFLYSNWEMTYSRTEGNNLYTAAKLVPFKVMTADSFIIEKDKEGNEIRYLPENSNLFSLSSNPWAVKIDDNKSIHVSSERWRNKKFQYIPIDDIVIVNGFVFTDKDYLYEQNSRAKTIRITYNTVSFDTELQDIGNFQVIHLPKAIDPLTNEDIKIEILDYYPGTKYSDIVISGIYYMDAIVK